MFKWEACWLFALTVTIELNVVILLPADMFLFPRNCCFELFVLVCEFTCASDLPEELLLTLLAR